MAPPIPMARDQVLAAVRAALAGVHVPALAPLAPAQASTSDVVALAMRFTSAARAVGTIVHEAASRGAAVDAVAAIIASAATAPRVVAWPTPPASGLAAAAVAGVSGAALRFVERGTTPAEVADADIGITAADALIAESGTLLLRSHARARTVSLLPPVHVAIVGRELLVADLGTALARVRSVDEPDSCLTLITGPSRTSDIEKKLVVGVHGPCALHVVLLAYAER